MNKIIIPIGERYGKLTTVRELPRKRLPCGQTNRVFLCKCDCGKTNEVRLAHLVRNKIISCGCVSSPYGGDSNSRLWQIWLNMVRRCNESSHGKDRKNYFERGIIVCYEWKTNWFIFKTWAIENGYSETLQLDREDNDRGYEPLNCRWVTHEVNSNNRRNTFFVNYKGVNEPIKMLMRRLGIEKHTDTIRARILAGWNHDEAVDTPIREGGFLRGKRSRSSPNK